MLCAQHSCPLLVNRTGSVIFACVTQSQKSAIHLEHTPGHRQAFTSHSFLLLTVMAWFFKITFILMDIFHLVYKNRMWLIIESRLALFYFKTHKTSTDFSYSFFVFSLSSCLSTPIWTGKPPFFWETLQENLLICWPRWCRCSPCACNFPAL